MLVNKQELENAIKKIYASYEDIPPEFNLILKAENNQLSVILNEWHTLGITINLKAQKVTNLLVAVDFLQFLSVVQNSQKETVEIEKIGNLLKVDQYFVNCWQLTTNCKDTGKKLYQFKAKSLEIKRGIEYVNYARSGDETKLILCGIGIHPGYIAATDSHRLAEYIYGDRDIQTKPIGFYKYQQLLNFLEDDQDVTITQYEYASIIESDNWIFYERIYHRVDYKSFIGCYPTTDQLVPRYVDSKVIIDRVDLISVIERVSVCVGKEKHEIIKLNFDYNNLTINCCTDQKHGEEKTEITSDSRIQKPLEIAMNVAYLLQAIKNLESEMITIEFDNNENTKPVIISGTDNEKKIALLMPIQLRK